MLTLQARHIGTVGKMLIQDVPTLYGALCGKTKTVHEQINDSQEGQPIALSDKQIFNALNGPYHVFFQQHFDALSRINRVILAQYLSKEEEIKKTDFEEALDLGVNKTLLERDSHEINRLRDTLNDMVPTHLAEWEAHDHESSQKLLDALAENGVHLNDIEITQFQLNETISEIDDRFVDLKLSLPSQKKKKQAEQDVMRFAFYFQLKVVLAIQSALSRLHLPHEQADIQGIVDKMQGVFEGILQEEVALGEREKAALDEMLKALG
jgi:hypothetical protein